MSKPTLISAYNPTDKELFVYDGTKIGDQRKLYGGQGITLSKYYNNWRAVKLDGFFDSNVEYFTSPKGYGSGELVTGKRQAGFNIDIKARATLRDKYESASPADDKVLIDNRQTVDDAYRFHKNAYNTDYVILTIIYKGQARQAQAILTNWKIENKNSVSVPTLTCTYMVFDGSWGNITFTTKVPLDKNTSSATEFFAEFPVFDYNVVMDADAQQVITLYPPDANGWNTLQFNCQFFDGNGQPIQKYILATLLVWNSNEKKFCGTTITDTTITTGTPLTITITKSGNMLVFTAKYNNTLTSTFSVSLTDTTMEKAETIKFSFTGTRTNTSSNRAVNTNSKIDFS